MPSKIQCMKLFQIRLKLSIFQVKGEHSSGVTMSIIWLIKNWCLNISIFKYFNSNIYLRLCILPWPKSYALTMLEVFWIWCETTLSTDSSSMAPFRAFNKRFRIVFIGDNHQYLRPHRNHSHSLKFYTDYEKYVTMSK